MQTDGQQISETTSFLIFTIQETQMAVDVTSVERMGSLDSTTGEDTDIFYIDTLIPFGKRQSSYKEPKLLILRGFAKPTAIVIDTPKDIVKVPSEQIMPLPAIIRRTLASHAIDSIFLLDDDIISILNPYTIIHVPRTSKGEICIST